jgi:hypothetical protein
VRRLHGPQQAPPQGPLRVTADRPCHRLHGGYNLLCFLDCYSGYHQIAIKEEDHEKTAFITPFGVYCYTTMSFGLKNASATYQ